MRIGNVFAHQRQRRRTRLIDFTHHAAEIEFEIGFEFAGELLHAFIVREAVHLQELDAAIARTQKGALKQHRADSVALPWLLDAEGGFSFAREYRAERAKFG